MLSLQQAIEIKESIKSYLQATFTFRKKRVATAFEDFIEHPTKGMFKGPFVSLKLRFVKAEAHEIEKIPLTIKPTWPPYDHQVKAWTKLATKGKLPEATIVTTGTGSGKTESFLYPILDYCFQHQHRPGVKVIILYPMNALAIDQAKRLAEMIAEDDRLKGKIRAGLFIGEGNGPKGQFPKVMGENHIIEHRDSILDSPPDILLTNFKMLDYALMKHNFHKLWSYNLQDTSLFQFLVLDELHTYDGAQGTDVANLIRRLKLKLKLPPQQLCAVGTSATIGSGADAPALLADYASKVFGEAITTDAIITENRITPQQFFEAEADLDDFIPETAVLDDLVYTEQYGFEAFIKQNLEVWKLNKDTLSQDLLKLKIVRDLVLVINKNKGIQLVTDVIRELSILNEAYRSIPQWNETHQYNPKERLLESLFAIISEAKDLDNPRSPFMYLQVQLWVRELSGVQYTLEKNAAFSFRDQVDAKQEIAALPPWYCRECNSSGWLGVKLENSDAFTKDINEVYEKYFSKNKNVYFLLQGNELSYDDFSATGYQPDDNLGIKINPTTLKILDKNEVGLGIQALRKLKENKIEDICPCCNTSGTMAIVGTKIPTLSSIAISQTLATDLDAATDQDRKILVFTNSVQDAAHQAGFVEGRNYRFALRASVQKVINEQEGAIRLDELANAFIEYWKQNGDETGKESLNGYLYRFFPKDYIGKSSPKDFLLGTKYAPHFLKEFDCRIQWEIYSEFGFNSKIGRTLEKTGASSVYFDKEKLHKTWDEVAYWITQNDVSGTIDRDAFIKLTNLILHRARNRGAIDHLYLSKFRKEKLSLWDLNWQKDGRHFLNPKFGTRSRFPKLLTNQQSRENLLDTTRAKTSNWFHTYFLKSFPQAAATVDFVNEFFEQWTQALLKVGILNEATAGDQQNFSIAPDAIWIHKNIKLYHCDVCEDAQYTYDDAAVIVDGSCVNYRCTGHYQVSTQTKNNYYKEVYNRNRTPRVFASEHTGLLERKVRERLEVDFKQRPRFNSVNALVATSTLEMGIDIGNLNTAYNNSIPPLPSNFLQRVGRAGRSSGSALIVNFAKNQNHDLYYFTNPMEMMAGEVNTPGCYLEAKDILRRHFTAYCFDSWTSQNPNQNGIPTFVRDLKVQSQDLLGEEFFINRLSKFIAENASLLKTDFLKQYDERIKEQIFPEIEKALQSGSFYTELLNVFIQIKEEIRFLEKRKKDIDNEVVTLSLAKGDPLFDEYVKEKKNLNGIKRSIAARNVLEHLTNVGVMPNYAFPETGVRLNAHVLSSKVEESTTLNPDKDFEIVRSASQAIKELAPENYFYTQSYRFEISGVNTFDWTDQANFHQKRFCSKCDHIETAAISKAGNCPKCGDASWSSSSNVHRFLKMTNVKSFNNAAKASLSDANDDRDKQQYQVLDHVLLDTKTSEGAWILKDIPFGIEYVKSAVITSVNYGRKDGNDARKIKINDTEALTKGFVTCKHCGKSVSATHLIQETKDFHYGYCKHKAERYDAGNTAVFEELYFFREMQTEVLKIVLPIQEFNSEVDIRMFQAGLELGLKKYFKGNPGHIHIQPYREFNQNTDKFDRFLLLYDTIPGGTGYLEQLFDYKEFTLLLQLSYEAIRDCACQLEKHDGCYKCIYSYGNQYNRADLSRSRAEKWFAKIYEKTEEWVLNNNGLTSITNSGKIEESELEERFIKLLSVYVEQQKGYSFIEKKENGTVYYEIQLNDGDIKALYWIRPQVVLGPKDGIEFSTRTDFLIVCGSYIYQGKEYRDDIKRIAIYVDGYQYHASDEHNVFERDIKIRKAIVEQQPYTTWTLNWDDLNLFQQQLNGDKQAEDELSQLFNSNFSPNYQKLLQTIDAEKRVNYALGKNNVQRLLQGMTQPTVIWNKSWHLYLGSWTKKFMEPSFNPEQFQLVVAGELTQDSYIKENRIKDFNALIPVQYDASFLFCKWNIWVNIGQQKILSTITLNEFQNIDKSQWKLYWSLYNVFQSSDESKFNDETEDAIVVDWENEVVKIYENYLQSVIKKAIEKGFITKSNADYLDSWLDDEGNVLADADLVLSDLKIAIQPSTLESEQVLRNAGFKIYTKDEVGSIIL